MSVSVLPVQTGGAVVLGVTLVKAGGTATANAVRELAATGPQHILAIAAAGSAMIAAGVGLLRGGRHLEISAGGDLD